jgi:thiamine-phosphate pyrophosphorylase
MRVGWPEKGLYAITPEGVTEAACLEKVSIALDTGLGALQYRDKSGTWAERLRLARRLGELCRAARIPLIINDDLALAIESGADGVHLGRDEMHLLETAAATSPRLLVGVSCYNDLSRAREAIARGADHIAFGSLYPSRTKPTAAHCGLPVLRTARQELGVPIVAIGGITPENGRAVIDAGADYLAAISSVFDTGDIAQAVRRYAELFA